MGQVQRGGDDVADSAWADSGVTQRLPASNQDREATFALPAQTPSGFTAALAELLCLERLGLDLHAAFARARGGQADHVGDLLAGPGAGTGADAVLLVRWFTAATITVLRRQVEAVTAVQAARVRSRHGFVLAVHEAVTTAVRHGGGHGQLVLWQRRDGRLCCQVSDHGPGITAAAMADSYRDLTPGRGEPCGLRLIRRVCTGLDITTDTTGTRLLLTC